jgi:hypothetical protein
MAKGQLAELRLWSIETTLPYQPNLAAFLRFSLGHDFFVGKARLWLAERAKSRGSHGGAPETGFKSELNQTFEYIPSALSPQFSALNPKLYTRKPQYGSTARSAPRRQARTLNPTPPHRAVRLAP